MAPATGGGRPKGTSTERRRPSPWLMTPAIVAVWALVLLYGVMMWRPAAAQWTRDPAEWYYCHAANYNPIASQFPASWDDVVCEHLLWQLEPGGGSYASLLMEGQVAAVGLPPNIGMATRIRGFVLPARHIASYTWDCTGAVQVCKVGGSGSAAALIKSDYDVYFTGDKFNQSANTSGLVSAGQCNSYAYDGVGTVGVDVADAFWTRDPTVDWYNNVNIGTFFQAEAQTIDDDYTAGASYSCRIVDWTDEASYGPWLPAPGDLVAAPTPTPFPTWVAPPTWSAPVTQPVRAGVTPMPTACYRALWGYTTTVPVWGAEVGFPETELCVEPYEIELEFFDINFGAMLTVLGAVMGLGALLSVVKRT